MSPVVLGQVCGAKSEQFVWEVLRCMKGYWCALFSCLSS